MPIHGGHSVVDGDLANVYEDPCQWQGAIVEPQVGPTVDDLANALAGQPQRGDAVPVDVSIGGYTGGCSS